MCYWKWHFINKFYLLSDLKCKPRHIFPLHCVCMCMNCWLILCVNLVHDPDIWSNLPRCSHEGYFLDEINILWGVLVKQQVMSICGWASLTSWRPWGKAELSWGKGHCSSRLPLDSCFSITFSTSPDCLPLLQSLDLGASMIMWARFLK